MVYNELEQGNILSEVRVGLASIAYTDISLRSIWAIYKIRQTPVIETLVELWLTVNKNRHALLDLHVRCERSSLQNAARHPGA